MAFFADLRLNVWSVGKGGTAKRRSLVLLADFCNSENFGVEGRLWTDLKVLDKATFEAELASCEQELEERFAKEGKKGASLGGVLLLVARVAPHGGGWSAPTLVATLKKRASPKRLDLAGVTKRPARGQCQSTEPPLATLWGKMEWFEQQVRPKVGLLKDFLGGLRLPGKKPGQRASTFNSLLGRCGCQGRVFAGRLKNKCGRRPRVATKKPFRKLYTFLQ